jgi:hypothetical protein
MVFSCGNERRLADWQQARPHALAVDRQGLAAQSRVKAETDADEVLVKRLLRGSAPGVYDLESLAGPTRHDARLRWAAHITAIIPPFQARRILIRGS